MPRRIGFSDALVDSRLAQLTGTTYPAPPAGLWISLLSGMPGSDGSNVVELSARVSVTYGAPASSSGDGGFPHTRFIQPTAAVSITPNGAASPPTYLAGAAWALWGVASNGSPLYIGQLNWRLQSGVAATVTASEFQVFAAEMV